MPGQNVYPNPDNYPVSSFRSPVPPPDVDPDEGDLLLVAYNPAWQEVLLGACMQLLNPATWQGTDAEIILVLNRAETLRLMLTESLDTVPTPFWDEAQDLDDQLPASSQTWYGEVVDPDAPADELVFIENAAIWLITGFIAYAGQIGGAIFFNTIAPRFVLAWRRGDVGEIIRVVVDAADYGTVDTGTVAVGEIIELEVLPLDQEAESHDITIIKVG